LGIRSVLFDMDGVLVFSEDAWFAVYNETLAQFGHAPIPREAFDAIYGNGTEADRALYMPERSVAEIDAAYTRFFQEHLEAIRPNDEAPRVLSDLRARGLRTGVATNTNRPLATRILGRFGLLPLLDAVACADEAGAGKPNPAVLYLAAGRLDVSLSATLFVGDSRYDAEAARRAPVPFVGYRLGGGVRVDTLSAVAALAAMG
jgi:phosphoglycolate phosphatase